MKSSNWKDLIKSKASAGFVITGIMAVAVVTAITLNQGEKTTQDPPIDLNEESNGANQSAENNDSLLEFDDYAGNLPNDDFNISGGVAKPSKTGEEVANERKNDTDSTEVADNKESENTIPGTQTEDNGKTNTADGTKTNTADGTKTDTKKAETDEKNTETAKANDPVQEVSGITVESLSFNAEDKLIWPVLGNVVLPYSEDHAIYHETLMQFKTNPAVLISCEAGTDVIAPVRGIITEISETPQTGVTVTMAIGNDYSLVYGQLEKGSLQIGDVFQSGDIIGKIAKVSKYYSVEGDNLYFKVLHGEKTIDPMSVLKTE